MFWGSYFRDIFWDSIGDGGGVAGARGGGESSDFGWGVVANDYWADLACGWGTLIGEPRDGATFRVVCVGSIGIGGWVVGDFIEWGVGEWDERLGLSWGGSRFDWGVDGLLWGIGNIDWGRSGAALAGTKVAHELAVDFAVGGRVRVIGVSGGGGKRGAG